MKNIYFIISHPIQYFVPLYQSIARNEGVNVLTLYCTSETINEGLDKDFGVEVKWDIPLLEGYKYIFANNRSWKPGVAKGFWGLFNPGIFKVLAKAPKGVVIVAGWNFASYWLAFFAAKMFGHELAIRCEAPLHGESAKMSGSKGVIRRFILKHLLFGMLVDKYLYVGFQNREFYKSYGIENSKLQFSPYSIDTNRFSERKRSISKGELRSEYGIGKKEFVILFTGKFIPRKRPLDLLQAFYRFKHPQKRLIMVGEGALRPQMEKYIEEHEISGVHLPGFINQLEIVNYYCLSDVLVMCSEFETWGLSVNEGMACGLPAIVTNSVGCGKDLVSEGYGWIYEMGNVTELVSCLMKASTGEHAIEELEEKVMTKAMNYSIDKAAEGVLELCNSVVDELRVKRSGNK